MSTTGRAFGLSASFCISRASTCSSRLRFSASVCGVLQKEKNGKCKHYFDGTSTKNEAEKAAFFFGSPVTTIIDRAKAKLLFTPAQLRSW